MILNLIIGFCEIQKLSLLYLAYSYNYRSAWTLIFLWLIWQLASAVLFGKLSDIKGRKLCLYITIFSSLIVSLLARSQASFSYALFIDGLLVSTLPIAFAAKNDQHPQRSKRLIYAEASFARAFPWFLIPLIYLSCGLPSLFWENAILISSIFSVIVLLFFRDKQDENCSHTQNKSGHSSSIFKSFVVIFLIAFFFSESSYQTVAYLVEEKESILPLTRSYILFGLGMSITSVAHLFIRDSKKFSLSKVCEITFLLVASYFAIKFVSFSWIYNQISLSFTEKTVLGIASGIYIPVIYAVVCEKFKIHQQGELCGLLESTMTLAEILSPGFGLVLLRYNLLGNEALLIIGCGFFMSYVTIRFNQLISKRI